MTVRFTYLLNIAVFCGTLYNFIRACTIDFNWWALIAILIAFIRVFFHSLLCFAGRGKEIRARRNFFYIMFVTTAADVALIVAEFSTVISLGST